MNLDLFGDDPVPINPPTGRRPYFVDQAEGWRRYTEAEVVAAGVAAYFTVFVETPAGEGGRAAAATPVERSPEPPPVPVSVTRDRSPGAAAAEYPMQPTGQANRWSYRDKLIAYDLRRELVPGRGRWSLVEGIGWPELRAAELADVIAAIDARLGAA